MTHSSILFIDLEAQFESLNPGICERMDRVRAHEQYIFGPEVKELEEQLEQFVGVEHCLGGASGIDALQIALMGFEIKPGVVRCALSAELKPTSRFFEYERCDGLIKRLAR